MLDIGQKIKELRKKNKFTQKQLGDSIGKSEISIRKYESGERTPPLDVIFEICNLFNVHPLELVGKNSGLLNEFLKGLDEEEQSYTLNSVFNTELSDIKELLNKYGYFVDLINIDGIQKIVIYEDGLVIAKIPEVDFVNQGNELIDSINKYTKFCISDFIAELKKKSD